MTARRVLLVSQRFWPLIGDAEHAMRLLAEGLVDRGHAVTVVTGCWSASWPDEVDYNGVHIVRLPRPAREGLPAWRYAWRIGDWLRKHGKQFDVACVSLLRRDAYSALGACRRLALPIVLRAEGIGASGDVHWQHHALLGGWIARRCRRAPAIVVGSALVEAELLAAGYPRESLHWIEPGVAAAPTHTAAARMAARDSLSTANAALGLSADTPLVVYAGRLDEGKGLEVLVDGWRAVRAARPQARLWLAGDGPYREELDNRIARMGLRGHVLMPGIFDITAELFAAADLFVLPSRCEAASLDLLGAMASGLPCVVSDSPGNRGLLDDHEHGLVVPGDDPQALAAAIVRLIGDAKLADRLGQAAQLHVRRSFPSDKMVNQHLQLFDQLLM